MAMNTAAYYHKSKCNYSIESHHAHVEDFSPLGKISTADLLCYLPTYVQLALEEWRESILEDIMSASLPVEILD